MPWARGGLKIIIPGLLFRMASFTAEQEEGSKSPFLIFGLLDDTDVRSWTVKWVVKTTGSDSWVREKGTHAQRKEANLLCRRIS